MKYKILKEIPPDERKVERIIITGSLFWRCEKCGLLYGKGETILEKEGWKICPIHTGTKIYSGNLDYWKERYELEEIKS